MAHFGVLELTTSLVLEVDGGELELVGLPVSKGGGGNKHHGKGESSRGYSLSHEGGRGVFNGSRYASSAPAGRRVVCTPGNTTNASVADRAAAAAATATRPARRPFIIFFTVVQGSI